MRKQDGFTLLELILALSIAGAILVVVVAAYFQVWAGKESIAQRSIAMTDVDNAMHWLSRDLVLAQTCSIVGGEPATSNFSMSWDDRTHWAGDTGTVTHNASYTLVGSRLLRNYDGEVTVVARFLTNFRVTIDGKEFDISLTSRPGLQQSAVSRNFSIAERSELAPQ